jgi:hypothetical protein
MKKIIFWSLALMLLAFLGGVAVVVQPFGMLRGSSSLPVLAPEVQVALAPRVQREVILYFAAPGSPLLEQQTREIDECSTEPDCIMGLVRALIAGPKNELAGTSAPVTELIPVLPTEALLVGAEVVDETAFLDFNQALISYHPGGCSSELLTVHALVNTLAANLPHIRQLVLRVDGKPIKTLRGHVDLRQPVVADFSRVRQESEVSTYNGEASDQSSSSQQPQTGEM